MTDVGYTGDKVCRLCGEFMERGSVIPALGYGHEHQFSEEWRFGVGMHWHECTVDGCSAKEDLEAHNSSDWELVTPATEETDGLKKRVCKTCGFVDEKIVPKGHVHSFSRLWTSDATKHWHACDCGAKSEEAAHTASNWIVETPAATTAKAAMHKECTVCGYVMNTITIPAIGSGGSTTPAKKPVQSVDTGDMGIALYAGMTILSLTGGAWVVNKKRKGK